VITRQNDLPDISEAIKDVHRLIYGIEISNPGQFGSVKEIGEGLKVYGGLNLNVFNSLSLKVFCESGCETVVLSPELNLSQIKGIVGRDRCEAVVHGRLCLMTVEYSLLGNLDGGSYGLKDRKGMVFPVYRDGTGRAEICNSQTLFMLDRMEEVVETGVGSVRLIHRDEKIQEFSGVVENYRRAISGLDYDKGIVKRYVNKGITRGHLYRGV